jgi:hypothetical protein
LWKELRENSYFNAWEMKDGKPSIKAEFKKYITEDHVDLMTSKAQAVNSEIDGQVNDLDRAAIHQSTFASMFAIHRGWMFTGIQKRLKKKGLNYSTDEMEEGSYRSISRHLWKFIQAVYRPDLMRVQLNNWSGLEEFEKRNLLRGIYEVRMMLAIYVVSLIFNKLADDDDEDDLLIQGAALLTSRLLTEQSVFVPPFTITEGLNTFKSPVAGINQLDQIRNVFMLLSDNDVKVGPYKGLNRGQKAMIKLTPGLKGWFESRDPKSKNKFIRMQALDWWPGL